MLARETDDAERSCGEVFGSLGATIHQGGNRAHYAQELDYVQMPPFEAFRDAESYYATLAHELTHWTKHEQRLNRDFGRKRWGDEGYASEELVAELGAAFLCADLKLRQEAREENAAYVATWLEVLRNDNRAIFAAAGILISSQLTSVLSAMISDTRQEYEFPPASDFERRKKETDHHDERCQGQKQHTLPIRAHKVQRFGFRLPLGRRRVLRWGLGAAFHSVILSTGSSSAGSSTLVLSVGAAYISIIVSQSSPDAKRR